MIGQPLSNENDYTTPGATYYVEHGWSGCTGSAWSTLTQATRDGWEAAAREAAARITAPPRINETVTVVGVVRTVETLFPDGHYRITVDADLNSPPGSGSGGDPS